MLFAGKRDRRGRFKMSETAKGREGRRNRFVRGSASYASSRAEVRARLDNHQLFFDLNTLRIQLKSKSKVTVSRETRMVR
jgi:hypothetical protein